ncbi:MAG: LysR substrate-binding domain-containing protein [Thalassobaculum sp.]|uniref:LysR substrate-binding domain-containing protein n=2 Tax=Thalassobaculum sp. TaxID=2022740 RepID=UPI0032EB8AA0
MADTLHFGRAAQRLDMLPASLGRHVRHLEEDLGTSLVARTTRNVALTDAGASLVEGARDLIDRADRLEREFRQMERARTPVLRVGVIDSVAAGLMPQLLPHFRSEHPGVRIELVEQKTIRLLPRLLSGRLDIAFVRPPEVQDSRLAFRLLFSETPVVALPTSHRLAGQATVHIAELVDEPLIVPDRGSRPHSHDLTIKLFLQSGFTARIAQVADEKQTIVGLVGTGIGIAIVPRWTSRLAVNGVRYVPIEIAPEAPSYRLSLSAAWLKGVRDGTRDQLMDTLERHLAEYAATA